MRMPLRCPPEPPARASLRRPLEHRGAIEGAEASSRASVSSRGSRADSMSYRLHSAVHSKCWLGSEAGPLHVQLIEQHPAPKHESLQFASPPHTAFGAQMPGALSGVSPSGKALSAPPSLVSSPTPSPVAGPLPTTEPSAVLRVPASPSFVCEPHPKANTTSPQHQIFFIVVSKKRKSRKEFRRHRSNHCASAKVACFCGFCGSSRAAGVNGRPRQSRRSCRE